MRFEAVAWVPWSAVDLDWPRQREPIAGQWILQRCLVEGRPGVLRVPAYADDWKRGHGPVSDFARRAAIVTNRSGAGSGPTLVPVAYDPRLVAGGMHCAQGSSLIVVENPFLPLAGWAMQLGAVDLSTGTVTRDVRTFQQVEQLAQMVDQGYNGWRSEPGLGSARHHMPRLAEMGMSWWVFFGSVLGMNPHRADLAELTRLAPREWRTQMEEHRRRATEDLRLR